MKPKVFKISIPEAAIRDLKSRLKHTRYPDKILGARWDYGTNLSYLKELIEYWRKRFDWRAQERTLNDFAHYWTKVGGKGIHFIHERGRGPRPAPLILTHGWPSTFFEMTKVIPMLADPGRYGGDPRDAFDVVVPSLPGFAFSEAPRKHGFSSWQIAELWAELMKKRLGYPRFFAHGGDIGVGVTTRLGLRFPERVAGIHITAVVDPPLGPQSPKLTGAERKYVEYRKQWHEQEGAYWHLQATRPQTLAYGLNDSPAGLAAWIVEKYRAWSDCQGNVERRFTKDELLTNVTLYWTTGTIGSSVRLYYENWGPQARAFKLGERVRIPVAVGLTREKVDLAPREWAKRFYNVQRWTEFPQGGHFMALEEPELLVKDIRAAFRPWR